MAFRQDILFSPRLRNTSSTKWEGGIRTHGDFSLAVKMRNTASIVRLKSSIGLTKVNDFATKMRLPLAFERQRAVVPLNCSKRTEVLPNRSKMKA
jgi:hypothetical protein